MITNCTVILSSGLVAPDLWGELGQVVSGRAPVAGRPLLAHLLEQVPEKRDVLVTLPPDELLLRNLCRAHPCTRVVDASPEESLLEVVSRAFDGLDRPVHLLFGDTLTELPVNEDEVQVATPTDLHRWTTVKRGADGLEFMPRGSAQCFPTAVTGSFAIGDPVSLKRVLDQRAADRNPESLYDAMCEYEQVTGRRFVLRVCDTWLDFGHLDTFFEARRLAFPSRAFNSVEYVAERHVVRKKSTDHDKLRLEVEWFESLGPDALLAPRLARVDEDFSAYETEYVPQLTVGEALTCSKLDLGYWQRFFRALDRCMDTLHADRKDTVSPIAMRSASASMLVDKMVTRLEQLRTQPAYELIAEIRSVNGRSVEPISQAIQSITQCLEEVVLAAPQRAARIHGDLFLGNLFFDRRADRVLMIDPRGSFGPPGSTGDVAYDLGKLSHSLLGGYDFIVADLFDVQIHGGDVTLRLFGDSTVPDLRGLANAFISERATRLRLTLSDVRLIEASCFLSLLPLHDDRPSRQVAFAASGLALSAEYATSQAATGPDR